MNNGFIYSILIKTFKEGDYFIGFLFWVLSVLVCLAGIGFLALMVDEYKWSQKIPFEHEAILISSSHKASTLETKAVPTVVAGGGVGIGVVTTGDSENYTTIWDCGEYGRLVSENDHVFQYAKTKSILFLKEKDNEVRICGIKT